MDICCCIARFCHWRSHKNTHESRDIFLLDFIFWFLLIFLSFHWCRRALAGGRPGWGRHIFHTYISYISYFFYDFISFCCAVFLWCAENYSRESSAALSSSERGKHRVRLSDKHSTVRFFGMWKWLRSREGKTFLLSENVVWKFSYMNFPPQPFLLYIFLHIERIFLLFSRPKHSIPRKSKWNIFSTQF